jgi:hypothetical protein
MKKGLLLLVFLIIVGCAKDDDFIEIDPVQEVPESLEIFDLIGIKLENTIVHDRVAMNVKLESAGYYRVKIRHGMDRELISQERIQAKEGDNILKVYVSSLDKSGYLIQLTDDNHNLLGAESFVVE